MTMLGTFIKPMHREGIKFVAIFAAATVALFFLSKILGWIGVLLTVWCYYFFRDPERVTPQRDGLLVSPADGVVSLIEPAVPPAELGMPDEALTRVSVFMNVFNCHVNRVPMNAIACVSKWRTGARLRWFRSPAWSPAGLSALLKRVQSWARVSALA